MSNISVSQRAQGGIGHLVQSRRSTAKEEFAVASKAGTPVRPVTTAACRGLDRLIEAGLITAERHKGRAPRVTIVEVRETKSRKESDQ